MSKTIKLRMQEGESVFGTWCMLPSSFVIDVIAGTGVDFVVIDMEHGTMSLKLQKKWFELHNCITANRLFELEMIKKIQSCML